MPFIGSARPYLDGPVISELQLIAKLPYFDNSGSCLKFLDAHNRVVVWFTKRWNALEVGAKIRAEFVVRSHRIYNGEAQNVVKRFRALIDIDIPS
jgi:hypothetical protein